MDVRPKKHLGQHFLKDKNIAKKISESLLLDTPNVLEVGPGMGVLTNFLKENTKSELYVAEVDPESVEYLIENKIMDLHHIVGDFLKLDIPNYYKYEVSIIRNLPHNTTRQIVIHTNEKRRYIVL